MQRVFKKARPPPHKIVFDGRVHLLGKEVGGIKEKNSTIQKNRWKVEGKPGFKTERTKESKQKVSQCQDRSLFLFVLVLFCTASTSLLSLF